MAEHTGHRERLKERFRQEGLSHFEPHNVLELLLFYCIPQKDTNPLAHRLIERFGSLHQVLEAPITELKKVEGISDHSATLLSLVTEISRYYLVSRSSEVQILHTTAQCGRFLVPYFVGLRDEVVYLLCLDAKCKVLGCPEVGRGSVNSAGVSVRRIVETALSLNATSVVLAHNHPSGLAIPSDEDVFTTRRVAMALDGVDILLADHIVVADEDFVSLADSGLYRPEECRMMI